MANPVKEYARAVARDISEHGRRTTHKEVMDRVLAKTSLIDVPDGLTLQVRYVAQNVREVLEEKDSDGVPKFLSSNATGEWNGPRTYHPIESANVEHMTRHAELRAKQRDSYDFQVRICRRTIDIHTEHPDWDLALCYAEAISEGVGGVEVTDD